MTTLRPERSLAGRHALVTGGSRGIGRAIVWRLAHDGAAVTFSYARDESAARSVAEEATRSAGVDVAGVRADLSDPASMIGLFDAAEERRGAVDIVVHNAAVENGTGPLADASDADYDLVMGGNARGGFTVLREASRRIRDGGRIVSISSLDTALPGAGNALYAASKAAVEQFTVIASKELGARGITANIVSPGAVDTTRLRGDKPAEELERAAAAASLGRLGAPDDIANVVAFLVSSEGGWVTGQNLRATGGIY